MTRTQTQERHGFDWRTKAELLKRTDGRCAHCGKRITDDLSVEHVIPLSKGGTNDESNLVALCEACNVEKSNLVVEPKFYYKHLTKRQLKPMQKAFRAYCDDITWFTLGNVFPVDWFELKAEFKDITWKGLNMSPGVFQVRKMRRNEVIAFMGDYSRKFGYDRTAPTCTDKIEHAYYAVTKDGRTLFAFGAHLETVTAKQTMCDIMTAKPSGTHTRYALVLDLFTDPGLSADKDSAYDAMRWAAAEICSFFNRSLDGIPAPLSIHVVISALKADRTAARIAEWMDLSAYQMHPRVRDTRCASQAEDVSRPMDRYQVGFATVLNIHAHKEFKSGVTRLSQNYKDGKISKETMMRKMSNMENKVAASTDRHMTSA